MRVMEDTLMPEVVRSTGGSRASPAARGPCPETGRPPPRTMGDHDGAGRAGDAPARHIILLRSKTPGGMFHEIHGEILAGYAIRDMMRETVLTIDRDSDRVFLIHAV